MAEVTVVGGGLSPVSFLLSPVSSWSCPRDRPACCLHAAVLSSARLQDLTFERDAQKAGSNAENHGVTFEGAAEAFLDPFFQSGEASAEGERRDFVLGYSLAQRLLLVTYEERRSAKRIISARPATRAERKLYEQGG